MKVRRHYTTFQDCSFPLAADENCVSPEKQWETSNPMLKTSLLFTPVLLQTDYFHFQKFVSASTNTVVPKTERGWVMTDSSAQWCLLPTSWGSAGRSTLFPPLLQQVSSVEEAGLAGCSLKGLRSFFSGAQSGHEDNGLFVSSSEGRIMTGKGNQLSRSSRWSWSRPARGQACPLPILA